MKQTYILGMIFVILVLLWLGSDLLKARLPVKEGFASPPSLTLNFCPSWAPQIQTVKGNTDCCEGEMVDGKCSRRTFCTLSPTHDNIPSCMNAWRQYFVDKSKQCPTNMPHYFENVKVKQSQKGCSASFRTSDGSTPSNPSSPKCIIYATERENRQNKDSCFIERERQKIRCPVYSGYTSKVELNTYMQGGKEVFGCFICAYSNPVGQRNSCNDEKSLMSMWDAQSPNWRNDKNRYTQLNNLSCKTFIERERQKEMERQRIEAERRKAEAERQKREAMQKRFTSLFSKLKDQANRAKQTAQNQLNSLKQKAEADKRAAAAKIQQMNDRLKVCK
jgi:hypothetical protein